MDFDLNTFQAITGGFKTVSDNFMPATGVRVLLLEAPFLLWCQFHGRNHGFEKDAGEFSLSDFIMAAGRKFESAWISNVCGDDVTFCLTDDRDVRRAQGVLRTLCRAVLRRAAPVARNTGPPSAILVRRQVVPQGHQHVPEEVRFYAHRRRERVRGELRGLPAGDQPLVQGDVREQHQPAVARDLVQAAARQAAVREVALQAADNLFRPPTISSGRSNFRVWTLWRSPPPDTCSSPSRYSSILSSSSLKARLGPPAPCAISWTVSAAAVRRHRQNDASA